MGSEAAAVVLRSFRSALRGDVGELKKLSVTMPKVVAKSVESQITVRRNQSEFQMAAVVFAWTKDTEKLHRTLRTMLEEGFSVPSDAYRSLIYSYMETNSINEAQYALLEAAACDLRFGEDLFIKLWKQAGETKNFQAMVNVYKAMRNQGLFSVEIAKKMAWLYAKYKQVDEAKEVFNELKTRAPGSHKELYVTLMRGYIDAQDTNKAFAVYDEMRLDNVKPTPVTWYTLIRVQTELGNLTAVKKLYHEAVLNGYRMRAEVNNGYLRALDKCSTIDELKQHLDYMRKMFEWSPNAASYSIIFNAYNRRKMFDEARMTLSEMLGAGFVPNELMVTSILRMFADANASEAIDMLFEKLKKTGFPFNCFHFSVLVSYMTKSKRFERAHEFLQFISDKKIPMDEQMVVEVIKLYLAQGNLPAARKQSQSLEHTRIKSITLTALIDAYIEAGLEAEAVRFFLLMISRGVRSSGRLYRVIIAVCHRTGDSQSLDRIVDHLKEHQASQGNTGINLPGVARSTVMESAGCESRQPKVSNGN